MTTTMKILPANPGADYRRHQDELDQAIAACLQRGQFLLGQDTEALEKEFSSFVGATYGIAVASGTEALHIALVSCGVGPDDEVITVAQTAVATVAAIELCGARPVCVDIEADYGTLDPTRLEAVITSRTKAVVPVHLYGHAADLRPILEVAHRRGLVVIEDAAQAHGATYGDQPVGSIGDIGCFSFYPTKNLGAFGDGGMVVTNDQQLAVRARALRQYGWDDGRRCLVPGWNARLDEIQAAVLRVKLRHLADDNARRRTLAGLYRERLAETSIIQPVERPGSTHVYHQYVVRTPQRDALQAALREQSVETQIHYPMPVHLHPAYQGRLAEIGDLPLTETWSREALSLPLYPALHEDDVSYIADVVVQWSQST